MSVVNDSNVNETVDLLALTSTTVNETVNLIASTTTLSSEDDNSFTYVESEVYHTDHRLIVMLGLILSLILISTLYVIFLICKRCRHWWRQRSPTWFVQRLNALNLIDF